MGLSYGGLAGKKAQDQITSDIVVVEIHQVIRKALGSRVEKGAKIM